MRLVEVEVENYKQYAGAHVFRPGEKAMVAIVGQNGAGKTTLFEAIEWCLYNPNHIRNDSLTPRIQGGKPRVRVVLEDPGSGLAYEIERSLKGGSTKAEIYRADQPGLQRHRRAVNCQALVRSRLLAGADRLQRNHRVFILAFAQRLRRRGGQFPHFGVRAREGLLHLRSRLFRRSRHPRFGVR